MKTKLITTLKISIILIILVELFFIPFTLLNYHNFNSLISTGQTTNAKITNFEIIRTGQSAIGVTTEFKATYEFTANNKIYTGKGLTQEKKETIKVYYDRNNPEKNTLGYIRLKPQYIAHTSLLSILIILLITLKITKSILYLEKFGIKTAAKIIKIDSPTSLTIQYANIIKTIKISPTIINNPKIGNTINIIYDPKNPNKFIFDNIN